MTDPSAKPPAKLSGGAKLAVDFGPLLVFLIAFFFGARLTQVAGGLFSQQWCLKQGAEMYLAVIAFMPAFAIALAYSYWKERRIAPMMMLSAVLIGVLGGLTLILHDKTFFYMKPTLIYALFAALLWGGLAAGRNFLKTVFDGALHMDDAPWRTLTQRYAAFFVALAVANEVAWRWLTRDCPVVIDTATAGGAFGWLLAECGGEKPAACGGEAAWVNIKVFGFTAANLIFVLAHAPFFAKHVNQPGEDA